LALFFGVGPAGTALVGGLWYYGTNKHIEVGYAPVQPIEYSHKLHAGDLGIDCRYCHSTVERSGFAQVPATETCMNCHAKVRTDSVKLLGVRESYASDKPIPWIKIHNLPDYVYFDHSAHLNAGVGCASCHGRVDQMIRVQQVKPLSMGWCIDCHRDPSAHLRDSPTEVTKMDWTGPSKAVALPGGGASINGREVHPPTHCSGCHR
jgi:hypothetical protein